VKDDRGAKILDRIKDVSDIFDEPMTGPMILDAKSNTVVPSPAPASPPSDEMAEPQPHPEATPSPEAAPADSAHPWNQNTFTSPEDKSDRHGDAGTIAPSAQQLELPLPEAAPRPGSPVKDSLESPRRRYAQSIPTAQAAHPLLSLAVQPARK
jgi:hypothetical protein